MKAVQQQVLQFVEQHQLTADIGTRLLDLMSELGEVSKEILKSTQYGKSSFVPTESWDEELGDLLFSLICLANQTNVDLEKSLQQVLEKYKARMKSKGHIGSGR